MDQVPPRPSARPRPAKGWAVAEWISLFGYFLVVNLPLFNMIIDFLRKAPEERYAEEFGFALMVYGLVFSPIITAAMLLLVGLVVARGGWAVFVRVAGVIFVVVTFVGILVISQTEELGGDSFFIIWPTASLLGGLATTILLGLRVIWVIMDDGGRV